MGLDAIHVAGDQTVPATGADGFVGTTTDGRGNGNGNGHENENEGPKGGGMRAPRVLPLVAGLDRRLRARKHTKICH